jgi:2-aminoethylphosphonate-pyruvate transaminase
MTRAISAEQVGAWAVRPAVDLWVVAGTDLRPDEPLTDGSTVTALADPSAFAVFDAMREAGVDDVRRVGVLAGTAAAVEAGRRAGVGAVVAVGGADLLRAEPDAVVPPEGFADLYARRYAASRPFRPQVLLNPGPALTSDGVKRAAAGLDLCHREPEFSLLDEGVRAKIRRVAGVGDGWGVVLLSGSGTAANEAAVRAAVRPGRGALVVVNGVYGERLLAMAKRARIRVVVSERAWTEPADPEEVAMLLAGDPGLDALLVVHHETTTGLLNPVAEIAAAAGEEGVRVLVDGISSFGAEELELDGSGIDFLTCTSNKCLQGLPGAAFVLVSPAGLARIAEVPPTSVYLDLAGYLRGVESASVPFTPAIPALASLDAALDEVLALGPDEHRRRYAARAAALDDVLGALGLEPIVAEGHRSRTVRSIPLPPGVDYAPLHDELKGHGYVIYAGQGPLAKEIFRVCCMGVLEPDVLQAFGGRLREAIDSQAVLA